MVTSSSVTRKMLVGHGWLGNDLTSCLGIELMKTYYTTHKARKYSMDLSTPCTKNMGSLFIIFYKCPPTMHVGWIRQIINQRLIFYLGKINNCWILSSRSHDLSSQCLISENESSLERWKHEEHIGSLENVVLELTAQFSFLYWRFESIPRLIFKTKVTEKSEKGWE